ncbi:UNVERIFIED_CONTAM: SelT-like protein, partial [Sesamum radiatum]
MDRTQLLLKATGIGFGNTVSIDFCSSCSYRGTAVTMKNMLENQFPGINVALANYPPPLPKRMLSKLIWEYGKHLATRKFPSVFPAEF